MSKFPRPDDDMRHINIVTGVVVPCFQVGAGVLDVIGAIGPEVQRIYVVDDACPDRTGDLVENESNDPRVTVIRHEENQGVGAAVISGYRRALEESCDVVVKLDGDGQMDPALIPRFVRPIAEGRADYTKGNRFFYLESARSMPWGRMQGNILLSFLTKVSSGYWRIFDPTNGYTAIHAKVLSHLPKNIGSAVVS